MCSVFAQLRYALSDMLLRSGFASCRPYPGRAMAYSSAALLDDVPEDELCGGVAPGQVLPISGGIATDGASIPPLERLWVAACHPQNGPGNENQQGWGNVMYIPAARQCVRKHGRVVKRRWRQAHHRGVPRAGTGEHGKGAARSRIFTASGAV